MHSEVPTLPNNWKAKSLGPCIAKFPLPYRTVEKLSVWVNTYPSSHSPQTLKINMLRSIHIQVPTPLNKITTEKLNLSTYSLNSKSPLTLPYNRNTKCLGQYIFKFQINYIHFLWMSLENYTVAKQKFFIKNL
jgi:hypothetical protein